MLVDNNQLTMEDDLSEDIIGSESIAKQLDENLVNATSIGNIAYVYQYTKDARTKEIAKQWITAFAEQLMIKFSKNNN
jgi:predicted transcriptional regulator